jgi:hypothetical protein
MSDSVREKLSKVKKSDDDSVREKLLKEKTSDDVELSNRKVFGKKV